ncbi:LysR substrate-binding domain-containing protein [Methylobacterium sp. J-077]|uniref:LysR substrate-binding domain-containing protein n=1 Tax=Methylobacterium sp. J-077 TaxID=2836656 RepID=UPI001FB8F701|nr:LysR substrate-binding domain-containing protein [Methylobacterium sp. J-077]MCJ2121409.1 LysR substrate-binding domain-containing protein [Methylobacterium sp. J-077]
MMIRTNLDMDVLRTFVTGFELGSFARAAERLGRSQSAVSTQLRKLEEQVGQPLVQKAGRGLALTPAGESMLGYAKRLLDLNDEAIDRLRGTELEGWARLGLVQDFAESWLPAVLKRFSRAYPRVRIEVQVGLGAQLVEKTLKGELDVALVWGDSGDTPHAQRVAAVPIHWIGQSDWPGLASLGREPLPFAAFVPPCTFRSAAVAALDGGGLPWRLVFTSPSLSGLWAAAEGGLGITARTAVGLPKTLSVLDPAETGLPALPCAPLTLHQAEANLSPAVARLTDILLETIREHVA